MSTILIADDEAKMRKILTLALMEDGHEILEAGDGLQAIDIIKNTSLSLVITDLRMPGGGGMAVLEAVKNINHYLPVIILTAYGTIENAVDALKQGAHDYLLKPCDLEEIKLTVRKALQVQHLELENLYLRQEVNERFGDGELVGKSSPMLHVMELIRRVALGEGAVLLRGESGTGKELAARAIHKQSPRAGQPFITVNCSSMPAALLELALFEPIGGTRGKSIHARIITSTNTDLEEKVRKGEIRSDLYFRLNVLPIVMPPLRERKEDIPLLIDHFIQKKTRKRAGLKFTSEQIETMMRYHWPGNVRELENVVERALVLDTTDVSVLLPSLNPPMTPASQMTYHKKEFLNLSYKDAKKYILDDFENYYFSNLLRRTHGNISRAAEEAQIHRKNLHVKLNELGIDPRQFAQSDAAEEAAGDGNSSRTG